jgi:hypothetical protein
MTDDDGTIDSVAVTMVDSSTTLGIIPTGTRNLRLLFRSVGEYLNIQEKD